MLYEGICDIKLPCSTFNPAGSLSTKIREWLAEMIKIDNSKTLAGAEKCQQAGIFRSKSCTQTQKCQLLYIPEVI